MSTPDAQRLPERPSKAQLRFATRYLYALHAMRQHDFTWRFGPAHLALLPDNTSRMEYVLSVAHPRTGPLGQLTLLPDGQLRTGEYSYPAERALSQVALMAWLHQRTDEACARIMRQNEQATGLNAIAYEKARRELTGSRGLALAGLAVLPAIGWALHPLVAQAPQWEWPALLGALGWAQLGLLSRWWYVSKWLKKRDTEAAGPRQ